MSMGEVREGLAMMHAGYATLAAAAMDLLSADELLEVGDALETLHRQLPTQGQRMLARLQVETTPQRLGAKSWRDVLRIRWRLSSVEANRRLGEAAELGPRRSLTGEPLGPVLPAVAAAQAGGLITAEHVAVLRETMGRLPGWVDPGTRTQIEVDLVRLAVGVGPKELADQATRRLFLLDQDGPEPDDTERARKRGVRLGPQGRDTMSAFTGHLSPEARATWEAIFAKFAAPGMCNPEDPEPCVSGTPSQAQIDDDHRSLAQRQHDAFVVVGRIALMGGDLGQLNGLPVSIIVRTTLQDLESRAGVGVTGGGTIVPIADVIRLGAHANHFLAVFDKATGSAMDLFRARRVASPDQRIMLIARDGGCTKPSCTVGAYGSQVHHAAATGPTTATPTSTSWAWRVGPTTVPWAPRGGPPGSPSATTWNGSRPHIWTPARPRINHYHHPETVVLPPAGAEPRNDTAETHNDTAEPRNDTAAVDSPPPGPTAESDCPEAESEPIGEFDPWDHPGHQRTRPTRANRTNRRTTAAPRRNRSTRGGRDEPEPADCAGPEPAADDSCNRRGTVRPVAARRG